MRILLTGASSFTGAWFARTLHQSGHDVVGTLRSGVNAYEGVRAARVAMLRSAGVTLMPNCRFGCEAFLATLSRGFDILCHHAAKVENYKSLDFDVCSAVSENTNNSRAVFEVAKASGVRSVIATGSVFEQDEGAGTRPLRAFSPYGLSKGLSWQVLRYWSKVVDIPIHKFIIANPFGPFEEQRFCTYLVKQWVRSEVATVSTPAYVRDNIHISLLAKAYAWFVEYAYGCREEIKFAPSGFVETQGAFARRFAQEIGNRLGIRAELRLTEQQDFSEPLVRVNYDSLHALSLGWQEADAWVELASYYQREYLSQ